MGMDSSVSEKKRKSINGKDLEDRNLLQEKSLKLEKIMNEKMSKRRIQITDLQKQESEERRLMHLVPAHFHWQMLTVSQSSITFLHYNPAFLFSFLSSVINNPTNFQKIVRY